eukprot:TRINITY_DN13983_c0_g1_i1.p2 TRINITY_DN13983_c0_g1~~TRINITY_DN13983_c0_g1_i1.p2  ORF type:complete len:237 (-),score=4.77 TRINITY_DN13983_c0_g1_i1:65-775(-)
MRAGARAPAQGVQQHTRNKCLRPVYTPEKVMQTAGDDTVYTPDIHERQPAHQKKTSVNHDEEYMPAHGSSGQKRSHRESSIPMTGKISFFAGGDRVSPMEFINLQDNGKTVFAPPTEVTDNGGFLYVTCQLHGIPEEEIRIDLEKGQLTLYASKQNETYLRKVTVPEGSTIARKKFHDGVLEITLEHPMYSALIPVSYTHLTLPTICSVQISVVAVSLKKKKKKLMKTNTQKTTQS